MDTMQASGRLTALSEREREILQRMAVGRSNQGICEDLGLAMKTVESHTGSIYTKLGLDAAPGANRRVLAVLAFLTERSTQSTHTNGRFNTDPVPAAIVGVPRRSCY
jgi:DNA-binding NarL/FixJ family response regulator